MSEDREILHRLDQIRDVLQTIENTVGSVLRTANFKDIILIVLLVLILWRVW